MIWEGNIEIRRGMKEVFDYTTEHFTEWSSHISHIEFHDKAPAKQGSVFTAFLKQLSGQNGIDGIISDYHSPFLYSLKINGENFDLKVAFHFQITKHGSTLVKQISEINTKGSLKFFVGFMALFFKKAASNRATRDLKNLKALIEKQTSIRS